MKLSQIVMLVAAVTAVPLLAQTSVQVQKAELAIPFGVAGGRLIAVGDLLVFADDEQPGSSFAVRRAEVRDLSVKEDVLTVETAKPVRDRSGERTSFTFRLGNPSAGSAMIAWFKAAETRPAAVTAVAAVPQVRTYQVRHDHFRGGCNGRLIIEPERVIFESISDLDHSRQWGLRDIKELKRDNPYGIRIEAFSGDTYNLGIQGQGMTSDEYRELVDRVTAARVRR